MQRDSIANTFIVSLVLCIVCSLLVSAAAVALKPARSRTNSSTASAISSKTLGLAEDQNR